MTALCVVGGQGAHRKSLEKASGKGGLREGRCVLGSGMGWAGGPGRTLAWVPVAVLSYLPGERPRSAS